MPDEATAQQTDDGSNDAGYQQYLRDYEQTKSKLAEKGKRAGTSMTFNEWLIKSEDAAPEQISDEQSSSGAKPARVKSATGTGVRELGNSGVELRINVEEPSAPSSNLVRFPGERRIDIGQHDPNYRKYLNNKAARDEGALENGEELEPPMDYEDFLDEQQAASEDEGYQQYLADHATKQEQAKKEGKPDVGEPKSYNDYLNEEAGLADPEYQKYLDDKEAAQQQAEAQGLDLGDEGEPLSYKNWQDEQAGKKDDDYQNYKKNLKPEEKAKPYRDWKKEKEEAKKTAEKPTTEEQPKGAETPTETKPPETEQPPKETAAEEPPPAPPVEPPKTEEQVETPEEEAERERAATTEPPTAEESGPGGIPPAGGPTPPEAPGEEKQKEGEGAQKSTTPPTTEGKEGEAAAQMSSNIQEASRMAVEQSITKGIAAGTQALTAVPVLGPIVKFIAAVVAFFKKIIGEEPAHILVSWILVSFILSTVLNFILPGIGMLAYPLSFFLIPVIFIIYKSEVEVPVLSNLTAKIGGPGFKANLKNVLRLITDGISQSVVPEAPKVGGPEKKP